MEKEQVAVDEAVETVAEQNTRAYSKTVWNESTPITADKLNKMEDGIASALPLTGGTMTGSITLPNSTKGQIKQTLTNGAITPTLYITSGDNLRVGSADIENVCIYSKTNPKVSVDGSTYTLYHTGRKPTASDIGALPLTGGTLTGKLAFENLGTGGGLNANIHNLALHANTGNGQMMTADRDRIYVGNPQTHLTIESKTNPIVNVNGTTYQLYHTGNKPTAGDVGALPLSGGTLTGFISVPGESRFNNGAYTDPWHGTTCAIKASGNVAVQGQMRLLNNSEAVFHEVCNARDIGMYLNNNNWGIYDYQKDRSVLRYNMDGDRVEVQGKRVATWEGSNPAHYMFRYGSGLGGANGYITFSY